MSVSEWCIRRPVATVLLMVGMVLAGMLGYFSLPISALPAVDFPTLEVRAGYPGASAEVMAASVTTPLERQLGQISGLEAMTSSTSEGFASITLRFDLGRDIDSAAQDVQAAINAASGVIPRNLPSPPTYSKVNPADAPILTLVASSKTLSLERVNDFADTALAQKLSQVSGVGLVSIQGNLKPAVRVRVNPGALANLGLSLEEVRAAILVSNVNSPKGTLDGKRQAYAIGTNDQITSARDFGSVVVAYRNGAPVRVQDLGAAVESVENVRIGAWVGGHPAVVVDVQRQPGANIIETAERVKALLPSLRLAAPPGVELGILQDRTETIRASIRDVQFTLGLTVILVVLVIFLFLRRLWATVIPGVALPLALIGTFGIMRLLGFSLNNLSLMAITISTGFVVDDAIVMIENIFRYIEEGEPPFTAAIKGAKQIGFTVISLSVSLIAVFIPLLFMPGVVGRLFKEFAMTLSAAVVVSAVVSLTLTPMMCARLLKPETEASRGWFFRVTEKGFDAALAWYAAGLRWVLRHRALTLWVTLGTLAVTVALYGRIPKGLLPLQDTGLLVGVTETSPTESFDAMVQRQAAVVEAVRADPDVVSVASLVGGGGMNPTLNTGKLYIQLRPREEGRAGSEVVMRRLRQAAGAVPGITLFLKGVQDIQLESRPSRTQYQLTLQSANEEELAQWAGRLKEGLERCRQLREVASDLQMGGLQVRVEVDRELASRRNVTMQAIDETLYSAFGQRQVSMVFSQLNQYRVVLEVEPGFQWDPGALEKIFVKSTTGQLVPLGALAAIRVGTGPLSVQHEQQFSAVTLSFNLGEGYSLGEAVEVIERTKQNLGFPVGIHCAYSGSAAEFGVSLKSAPYLLLAAVVVIYIVLGVLYESYVHPVTILSSLPSAGMGALLALEWAGMDLSLVALIGIILLIGIVKKNAIMMIDFALEAERERGMSAEQSIYEACLLRFRPIMMTTMAALLGALPMALEKGVGSEFRNPLGITILGGLVVSQILTLYTTPVIYLGLDRVSAGVRRWWRGARGCTVG